MKNKIAAITFLTIAALLTACSGGSAKKPVSSAAETLTIADPTQQQAPSAPGPKFLRESTVSGTDNSDITTSVDENGNKIETRNFRNNSRVSFIEVQTFEDGTKVAFIHGKNGEKIQLPVDLLSVALNASGDDLANVAEIKEQDFAQPGQAALAGVPTPPATESNPVANGTGGKVPGVSTGTQTSSGDQESSREYPAKTPSQTSKKNSDEAAQDLQRKLPMGTTRPVDQE